MNWEEISRKKAEIWLTNSFDEETRKSVKDILKNKDLLIDSFAEDLEFGTGGMRGIMGVGTKRINNYTLGKITQGLANFINQSFPKQEKSIVLAYDVRHNSKEYAKRIAEVLSANGILVYVFDDFRPTPLLSFAVRQLGCVAGIVLTASHNPPKYHGYKVYWQDGGQLVPPIDAKIVESINKVEFGDVLSEANSKKIISVPKEIEKSYIQKCVEECKKIESLDRSKLKVVFSPIHGTSVNILPKILRESGFSNLLLVEEQCKPSGDFPTVVSPNPEEPEALKMAMDLATKERADLLMGTDPDADRLGVGVNDGKNQMVLLNGNQTNTILAYFLLENLKQKNKLKASSFLASTIVSSEIFPALAQHFGIQCKLGLTGFKWIGKMIEEKTEEEDFVFGGEESYGALVGDFVRDKDALLISALVCEVAAFLKNKNQTLLDYLDAIYQKVGYFQEELISIGKEGIQGKEDINRLMKNLRENPPKEIAGEKVVIVEDYKTAPTLYNLETQESKSIAIEPADVLILRTEKQSKLAIRPSGTEPKIKFYLGVYESPSNDLKTSIEKSAQKLLKIKEVVADWLE